MSSCRCPSCGYLHVPVRDERPPAVPDAKWENDNWKPEPAAPVAVAVVAAPVVIQQARCPLCGQLFDDPAEYDGHRARNCADKPAPDPPPAPPAPPEPPPPPEPPAPPAGDPAATTDNPGGA